jgi:uncharacterized membrane protein YphA (DoxX/SURF4 family)
MKIITQVARVLVGLLFIFSGVIKANDPIGFSYKLDEYFSVFGEHIWGPLAWFENISIFLAIFITGLEILQGLMLLSGSRIKWNSWALLALIVFFTFLTFYSAYTGYIKECGCFGDVIPLKAWGSFYKDLILLVLILIILIGKKYINPIIRKPKYDNVLVVLFTLVSFAFPLYTFAYLPIHMDYKSSEFAVGHNIMDQRKAYMDEQKKKMGEMKFIYKNNTTGKNVELTMDGLTKAAAADTAFYTNHTFVDRVEPKADTTEKKLLPLSVAIDIVDKDNNNFTDQFIGNVNYQFILFYTHLDKASDKAVVKIRDFAGLAEKNKVSFIGLTNSDWNMIEDYRHHNQLAFDFYRCTDDTPLKGAIRSNPGLILFKGGKVIAKWHYNAFPSFNDVQDKYMK